MSWTMEKAIVSTLISIQRRHMSKCGSHILRKQFCPVSQVYCGNKATHHVKDFNLPGFMYENKIFYATQENLKENKRENKTVIYYGMLSSKIKGLKVFSLSTSLLTICLQPFIYKGVTNLALPVSAALYTFIGLFTFVTPFIIHTITKRYITEILYNPSQDLYTSKSMTFFLREKIDNFKLDDIKSVESVSIFTTFYIKDRPVIIFAKDFLDKDHYVKIMGYDKPISLEFDDVSEFESEKKEVTKNN